MTCSEFTTNAWVQVTGPQTQRDLAGRALAAEPRFGTDIPVVSSEGAAADGIIVAYRSDYSGEAAHVAALLERDLGGQPRLLEHPESEAPIVVSASGFGS
ncbi:MAG: hypothetical protein ACI855_002202 [Myxococcota bacterium]